MSANQGALPLLLSNSESYPISFDPYRTNVTELKKIAKRWLEGKQAPTSREPLVQALQEALQGEKGAAFAVRSMTKQEREVASVYRRYGGNVSGELIRVELMTRGILEILDHKESEYYQYRTWKSNPIESLANQWVLLSAEYADPYGYRYGFAPERVFQRYSLNPGVAKLIEPAGPAKWSIPASTGIAHEITRRTPAEVALSLSRILSFVAMRGSLKTLKNGDLGSAALKVLEKGVPIEKDSEFILLDPHALYLSLLMSCGAIVAVAGASHVDPAAATRMFSMPDQLQAQTWALGWLHSRNWFDGYGFVESRVSNDTYSSPIRAREILAWALGGLAREGRHWYDLATFISALHDLVRGLQLSVTSVRLPWDPKFPEAVDADKLKYQDPNRARAIWYAREGKWFANVLMVTLVELGMVERGRLGPRKNDPVGFRLTEIGRVVFGAPEVTTSVEDRELKFLLIQPNFDVVAYLEHADARSAGILGRLAEGDSTTSGPVHTFRITQKSIYQAEESGLTKADIVDFLRKHGQREPPPNVIKSIEDWSGKRESLILRSGVTLVAFATTAQRDALLKQRPGTACGERFAIMTGPVLAKFFEEKPLLTHLPANGRRIFEMDENGLLWTSAPIDIVQESRLRRIALKTPKGWQINGDTIRRAAASGLKPTWVRRVLNDILVVEPPMLIDMAIDAWMGKSPPVELAEATLLFVPSYELYDAIASSERLSPYILGSPGEHWFAVDPGTRKKFAAALEELGFKVDTEFKQGNISLEEYMDEDDGYGYDKDDDDW